MKIRFLILFLYSISIWPAVAQQVKVVKFEELNSLIRQNDDTLRVINFWATWCGPCVKELPYFEKIVKQNPDKKIKVILVSMDHVGTLNTKVRPFVLRHKLKSKVVLLNEPDLESWVDKLTPEWSGALPMTLFYNENSKVRDVKEKALSEPELKLLINKYRP